MRAHLFLGLFFLPLAACHDRDSDGASMSITANDGGELASANGATGEVKVDLPGLQGKIKLPKIQLKSDDFDLNGVHLYPGSAIEGVNVDAGKGKGDDRVRVTFTSPAAPATVRDWFASRLNDRAHYDVKPTGNGLVGKTDEGKPFRLDLTADGTDKAKGIIELTS